MTICTAMKAETGCELAATTTVSTAAQASTTSTAETVATRSHSQVATKSAEALACYGLVPARFDDFRDVEGRCFLLLGELTPQTLDRGVVSNGFETPALGVIAGGEYIDDSTECKSEPARTLGYDWILDAQALPGTTIPFFADIFIPSTNPAAITSIVLGNPRFDDSSISLAPTTLATVPVPTGLRVGPPAAAAPLNANATFTYSEGPDAAWNGKLHEVRQADLGQFTAQTGQCYLVLGELTPTAIEGIVSNGFDTPSIGGIAGGRHITSTFGCDTDAVEALGYDWILNAEVTVGTTFKFYSAIVVPEPNGNPLTQVIIGPATSDALVYNVP